MYSIFLYVLGLVLSSLVLWHVRHIIQCKSTLSAFPEKQALGREVLSFPWSATLFKTLVCFTMHTTVLHVPGAEMSLSSFVSCSRTHTGSRRGTAWHAVSKTCLCSSAWGQLAWKSWLKYCALPANGDYACGVQDKEQAKERGGTITWIMLFAFPTETRPGVPVLWSYHCSSKCLLCFWSCTIQH